MALLTEDEIVGRARSVSRQLHKSADRLLERRADSAEGEAFDVFLSHSSAEPSEILLGIKSRPEEEGLSVYVDSVNDPRLGEKAVDRAVATLLRQRMSTSQSLLYVFSQHSKASRWMPWELGYFDGMSGRVGIVPGSSSSLGVFQAIESLSGGNLIATVDSNGTLSLWDLARAADTRASPVFQVPLQDSDMREPERVRFLPSSHFVGMGGKSGGVLLCNLSEHCGPVEPVEHAAPFREGQWIELVSAPDQAWFAAVSETRRVHFFRGGDWTNSFYSMDVLDSAERIPVATRGYIIMSGSPGRQVQVVSSKTASWAVAFEAQQYGYDKELTLVKVAGEPIHIKLGPKELGCASFSGVTFDPREDLLLTWSTAASQPGVCASVLHLPASGSNSAKPVKIETLQGYRGGFLEFSEGGEFVFVRADRFHSGHDLWIRSADNSLTRDINGSSDSSPGIVAIASDGTWLIARAADKKVHAFKATPLGPRYSDDGPDLGSYSEGAVAAFSPGSRWLVIADRDDRTSQLRVNVWRTGEFSSPNNSWQVPASKETPQIVFDKAGRSAVVGPQELDIDTSDPPARTDALLLDLRSGEASVRRLDIALEGRPESSRVDVGFEFDISGKWLAGGPTGNLWQVDSGSRVFSVKDEAYPVFSDDSNWLALVGDATRLLHLSPQRVEDRGVVGPSGSVTFTKGSHSLLILSNGRIEEHSLEPDGLLRHAAQYLGRNLSIYDWQREFPDEPYAPLFPEFSVHVSVIEDLVTRGQQARHDGNDGAAIKNFAQAAKFAISGNSVDVCRAVVEAGIHAGVARTVLPAAEHALVILPKDVWLRDLRGKVRAAAGDPAGAIEDFEYVVNDLHSHVSPDNRRESVRHTDWIKRLKAGGSIPADELLNSPLENMVLEWAPDPAQPNGGSSGSSGAIRP